MKNRQGEAYNYRFSTAKPWDGPRIFASIHGAIACAEETGWKHLATFETIGGQRVMVGKSRSRIVEEMRLLPHKAKTLIFHQRNKNGNRTR